MDSPTATISSGNTAWVLMCVVLVFLMTPALGLFYAGMAKAKNALSLMYVTMLCMAVVSFQWYLIGYSLTFSETGSFFIGDSRHFLLRGVGFQPAHQPHTIPALVFMMFQSMFACLTPALAFGAAAERMSLGPAIVFIFVWTTLVYDFITCWVWNPNGWLAKMGAMDFAGGATVHASSGLAAVAYSMVLGKRRDFKANAHHTPHNLSYIFIGLALLWLGWFGFNAGSGLAADARAANSLVSTHLAGCVAAIVWVLIDFMYTRKWSLLGLCTGVVAGLATITPGSGYVSPSSALAFGLLGSIACNYAVRYKQKYYFDDALDVFTVHYVGSLVGLILTGIFAERSIIALGAPEGTPLEEIQIGGWLDGHWMQVPIQLALTVSVSAWAFFVTYIILIVIHYIPFPLFQLRLDEKDEEIGTDWAEMGERAYGYVQWEEASNINYSASLYSKEHQHKSKSPSPFRSIKRLLFKERRTSIGGVPTMIEEPVLDYSQPSKAVGSDPIHLSKLQPVTTNHSSTSARHDMCSIEEIPYTSNEISHYSNSGITTYTEYVGSNTSSHHSDNAGIQIYTESIDPLSTNHHQNNGSSSHSEASGSNTKQKARA